MVALDPVDGAPVLAVGLCLIGLGHTRRKLTLRGPEGAPFRWKGPVILDRSSRQALDAVLARVAQIASDGGGVVVWRGARPPAESGDPETSGG